MVYYFESAEHLTRRVIRLSTGLRGCGAPQRRWFVGTELESCMLKVTNRPVTATIPYNASVDITSPPRLVVNALRITWSTVSDSK